MCSINMRVNKLKDIVNTLKKVSIFLSKKPFLIMVCERRNIQLRNKVIPSL